MLNNSYTLILSSCRLPFVFYLFAIVRSAFAQWWLVIASFDLYAYWDVT